MDLENMFEQMLSAARTGGKEGDLRLKVPKHEEWQPQRKPIEIR